MGLYSFADSAAFAGRLADLTGVAHAGLREHRFPDGESLVRAPAPAARRALLVRSLDRPNAKLVEILLAADALRRAGARAVTLIAPYLGYMRQDAVFNAGEPVSQRVVGELLAGGFDAVVTVEPHLHRVRRLAEVAGGGAVSVSAAGVIRDWVRRAAPGALVVGPDVESEPWIRAIAGDSLPFLIGRKRRHGDRRVSVELGETPRARRAVVVDDIASSGATLAATARLLRRSGVRRVDAVVVHAIFAPGAERRIRAAGVARLLSSDSVPHPTNGYSVAPAVAAALRDARLC